MRIALALVLGVFGSVAHAERVPSLKLGSVSGGGAVGRVQTAMFGDETSRRATWRIELVTTSNTANELVIPITAPSDLAITQITLSLAGIDEPLVGEKRQPVSARVAYEAVLETYRDPALLEWVSTSGETTQLRLRVFPVSKDRSATVTIQASPGVKGGNVTSESSLVAVPLTNMAGARLTFRSRAPSVPEVADARCLPSARHAHSGR